MKKLKAARDRKSNLHGRRIEGRKSYSQTQPELVRTAKRLVHGNRKRKLSLCAASQLNFGNGVREQRHALFGGSGKTSSSIVTC